MLIKCLECGHDNQMGAIFCRDCGTKLDMEAIKPKAESKIKLKVGGLIRNIISIAVLLVVFYILGMMFYPQSTTSVALSEDDGIKASEKFKAMVGKMQGKFGDKKYIFTPDEVTYIYNNDMTESAEGADAGSYAIENMYFTLDPRNFIHIMIQSKLAGKVPVTFALKGSIIDDSVQFSVISAKMGHLSMPKFLKGKITEKFTPGINDGVIKTVLENSARFEVINGDLVITVKDQ